MDANNSLGKDHVSFQGINRSLVKINFKIYNVSKKLLVEEQKFKQWRETIYTWRKITFLHKNNVFIGTPRSMEMVFNYCVLVIT